MADFMSFKLVERGPTPGILRREQPVISKAAFLLVGRHWHASIRPKHFTPAGAQEYRYKRLTRDYLARKVRKLGHTDPLFWTGRSKRQTAIRDVRATSKGVRVTMRAPALNVRPRGHVGTLREQLLAASQHDAKRVAILWSKAWVRLANRIRKRKTTQL